MGHAKARAGTYGASGARRLRWGRVRWCGGEWRALPPLSRPISSSSATTARSRKCDSGHSPGVACFIHAGCHSATVPPPSPLASERDATAAGVVSPPATAPPPGVGPPP
eukprot:7128848-Prymnesium_polylepis.1